MKILVTGAAGFIGNAIAKELKGSDHEVILTDILMPDELHGHAYTYADLTNQDAVNNLPDVLLKNLATTLGLDTINLVNEKSLNDLLYSKTTAQYAGVSGEMTPIEAEYEFYRRLLVNLSYIYKSKGTRKSLEFFFLPLNHLKFQ